jgi:hypothetical protein
MNIQKMTDIELIAEYNTINELVSAYCGNTSETIYLQALARELENRHYTITASK